MPIIEMAGLALLILSLVAGVFFFSLSTITLVTRRVSRWWRACFLVCSLALGGWMVFYTWLLLVGGGVMVFRSNLLLFLFLIFAVLVSAILRFASPERYIAILVVVVSLVVFHVVAPVLTFREAISLIRQK
jgi:hypothetical protein